MQLKFRGSKMNKILDRFVGIPLLAFVFLWKYLRYRFFAKPQRPSNKKLLALQMVAIGDAVLTLPSLQAFREMGYEVWVLSGKANDSLYKLNGYQTICFQLKDFLKNPSLFIQKIKLQEFDTIVDFHPWPRLSALICALLMTAKNKLIGFKTNRQYRSFIFDISVNHSSDVHESENYFNLVRSLHPNLKITSFLHAFSAEKLPVNPDEIEKKTGILFSKIPFVVFHPWSAGYRAGDKEWPVKNFTELADSLPKGVVAIVTGTQEDKPKTNVWSDHSRILSICGKTNLLETLWILSRAKAVVTVNTGILHLASYLGQNLISLNGPATDRRWGALQFSRDQKIVNHNAKVPCSPCLNLGFEFACKKGFCMPTISPKEVSESLRRLLEN